MTAVRSISVLMPILNGEEFLERVLGSLCNQKISIPWDFLAVDCGSTDRTLAIFEEYAERLPVPLLVHGIHLSEFNHGDTRNLLVALSSGELVVFLTDDAIPVGTDWLARIAANFEDERIAACHVRNLPRSEVSELLKVTSARDPNYQAGRKVTFLTDELHLGDLDGAGRRALYNYNDVASAMRRNIWERYPYPHCDFGEDVLLGRAVLEAGYGVVYEDGACVQHSHEYDCEQLFERGRQDALFNAEHLHYRCVEQETDIAALVERKLQLDRKDLEACGLPPDRLEPELARSEKESTAFFSGMYAGSRSERRFRGTGFNAVAHPRIEAYGLPHEIQHALTERGWTFIQEGEGGDVLHVHGEEPEALARLRASVLAGQPVLWTVTDEWAREHKMQRSLLGAAECEDNDRLGHPPDVLAFEPRPSIVPFELCIMRGARELETLRGSKSMRAVPAAEECLRMLEIRYRSLASSKRDARGHCPFDRRGDEAVHLEGDAECISRGGLLLRAGAVAEWDIRGVPPGASSLLVSLDTLGIEPGVVTGGQVFVDDEFCGVLGPYRGCDGDERRHLRITLNINAVSKRLRLLARTPDGNGMVLRVNRMRLIDDTHMVGRRDMEERSLDLRGQDGTGHGRAAAEGCDMLRIGPKRATGDWRIDGLEAGQYRVRIWLAFAESEHWLEQSGRLLLNGRTAARFSHVNCPEGGGTCMLETVVELPDGGCSLSISNRQHAFAMKGFARVQRLQIAPTRTALTNQTVQQRRPSSFFGNGFANVFGHHADMEESTHGLASESHTGPG